MRNAKNNNAGVLAQDGGALAARLFDSSKLAALAFLVVQLLVIKIRVALVSSGGLPCV
jgi:hypothetical protein